MRQFAMLIISMVLASGAASAADTYAMQSISFDAASNILKGALKEANKQDRNVAIVVVDAAGEIIAAARMDGAKPIAMKIALRKANTALLFRGASRSAAGAIDGGAASLLTLDGLAALPGGLAVNIDSDFVGAIGVSGAPADIDELIAGAGLKRIKN